MTSSDRSQHGPGGRPRSPETPSTPVPGGRERQGGVSDAQMAVQPLLVARPVSSRGGPGSTHAAGTCSCGIAHNRPAEYDAPADGRDTITNQQWNDAATAVDEAVRLSTERDQARDIAVELENQLAAVRDLHVDSYTTRGMGRATDIPPGYWTAYCEHDQQDWPCATIRALGGEDGK
jgi:hypothetical protein